MISATCLSLINENIERALFWQCPFEAHFFDAYFDAHFEFQLFRRLSRLNRLPPPGAGARARGQSGAVKRAILARARGPLKPNEAA